MRATGMLRATMPKDVEREMPARAAILESRAAMPVNPLGRSCTGSRKTFMVNACRRAETVTAAAMTRYLFFIALFLF